MSVIYAMLFCWCCTLQAGEESPANEAKRAKLDNKKIPEVDETTVNEETKAEA